MSATIFAPVYIVVVNRPRFKGWSQNDRSPKDIVLCKSWWSGRPLHDVRCQSAIFGLSRVREPGTVSGITVDREPIVRRKIIN